MNYFFNFRYYIQQVVSKQTFVKQTTCQQAIRYQLEMALMASRYVLTNGIK